MREEIKWWKEGLETALDKKKPRFLQSGRKNVQNSGCGLWISLNTNEYEYYEPIKVDNFINA
jgi:hypothetical protein